jgi:hypothetical protein
LRGRCHTIHTGSLTTIISEDPEKQRAIAAQKHAATTQGEQRGPRYGDVPPHLEELGLIKYGILGLANLTILDNALKFIKEARGEEINLEKLPLDPVPDNEEQNRKRACNLMCDLR